MLLGALVPVVGPSGAGKDTLIGAAQKALRGDERFVFPRRIVTRDAVAELEDHDSLDREAFALARGRGAFALDWEAHGLCYGLPGEIDANIAGGRIVVANLSRRVLADALAKYRRTRVVLVTASVEVRAQRLAGRGRESAEDIAARLSREGAPVPAGLSPIDIDNSGALEAGIAAFAEVLARIAAE